MYIGLFIYRTESNFRPTLSSMYIQLHSRATLRTMACVAHCFQNYVGRIPAPCTCISLFGSVQGIRGLIKVWCLFGLLIFVYVITGALLVLKALRQNSLRRLPINVMWQISGRR